MVCKSSSPFINHLGIVSSVPITNGITVIFMFHSLFFYSLANSRYSSLFLLSFISPCGPPWQQNLLFGRFLFCWLSRSLVVWPILGDLFVSQVGSSNSPGQILVCAYTTCFMVKFHFRRDYLPHPVEFSLILFLS